MLDWIGQFQNFPGGAAVSIPLRREGFSRTKAFIYGQASGVVEPIAGVVGAAAVYMPGFTVMMVLDVAMG